MNLAYSKDKVVAIIGASSGIGKATADLLRGHGIKSVLGSGSISEAELENEQKAISIFQLDAKPHTASMIPMGSITEYIAYLLWPPKNSVVDEITIQPPGGIL
ncbi:hypothetical protein [Oceanobacillus damuensis]|uniref:hypothetical protein n=1 Tax=Oceanobacillus damuensis TaxID=937928 RepID=UPI0008358777|nr:hypothetical protein [Oceanobacillus damuensis]